ncbi:hypothetical protein R70331_07325 [Paenibacillus sp. FSL R7-0331]|nr:hypothetical protein R70331_07325 [Paenibacillus sp. FSL R7-0331]
MGRNKEFEINEVLDKALQLFWMQGFEKQEPVKELIRRFLESSIERDREPLGCFIVNSGVELGVLNSEVGSLVEDSYSKTEELLYHLVQTGQQRGELRASLEPEAISYYLMHAWLALRTMVKTATDQGELHYLYYDMVTPTPPR